MILFKTIKDIENQINKLKKEGVSIGFVPTMGALHLGHISLIKEAKKTCQQVVCSIFVNPTQFNDKADFEKYPITIDRDIELLVEAGCDMLFLPSVKEMYPDGLTNKTPVDFGFLAQTLEGEFRPGHFDGMAQVVERLLRIVKPHKLYMGRKDYQQQLIVKELIRKRRLHIELVPCNTVREKDGLAMSSRNVRLDKKARTASVTISKTLTEVKKRIKAGADIAQTRQWAYAQLTAGKGFNTEYFEIRNAETLKPVVKKQEPKVALVATKIGGVRLIDNMLL